MVVRPLTTRLAQRPARALRTGLLRTALANVGSVSPVRAVTTQNRVNKGHDNGGSTSAGVQGAVGVSARTGWGRRWHHTIGSGDVDKIRFRYDGWYGSSGTSTTPNLGNDYTITGGVVECNGFVVPILFSGGRSKTIVDGDVDIYCDWLYPSQFGLAKFSRGDMFYTKELGTVPVVNGRLPTQNRNASDYTGCQMFFYAPNETTVSTVDAAGVFTSTGALLYTRANGAAPVVYGTFIGGDKPVRLVHGDSITEGTGDGAFKHGRGWFQRAQVDADGDSNPYASINLAIHGSTSALAANARMKSYYAYANSVVIFYGTNDFGSVGTGTTSAAMLTSVNTMKTAANTGGITKVAVHELGVRASSSDSLWANEANQTTFSGWGAGGEPDLYNQALATAGFTTVFTNQSCRGTDRFKWITNGTTKYAANDDTHPSAGGYILMADENRAKFALLDAA